jgi:hypothetical protein
MRALSTLSFIGLTGCLGVAACSSSKEDANSGTTPGYNAGNGTSGQYAQDTVDGQLAISASTHTTLNANACVQGHEAPKGSAQPILEFVIDASGSMQSDPANPEDPNSQSKWDVFSATMPGVFASLPSNFAVGVSYYNKSKSGDFALNQVVPIGILDANQLKRTQDSIQSANVGGYTPTYSAWDSGYNTIYNWKAPAGYETSQKYIVLITDGIPTVTQEGKIQQPISQTEYDGELTAIQTKENVDPGAVKTFVVGVVGSENPQGATYDPLYMLSKLAVIGGTASAGCVPKSGTPAGTTVNPRGTYCHFDLSQAADFAAALTSSLGTIAQSVVSCDYGVPAAPSGKAIDPDQIVLEYDHGDGTYSLILQNTSATCDKGWQFTDATNSQIHICGVTCDQIQSNAAAALNLVFGCGVGQIVN